MAKTTPMTCDEYIVVTLTDIWGVEWPEIIFHSLHKRCQLRIRPFLTVSLLPIAIGALAMIMGIALVFGWRRWGQLWLHKTGLATTPTEAVGWRWWGQPWQRKSGLTTIPTEAV